MIDIKTHTNTKYTLAAGTRKSAYQWRGLGLSDKYAALHCIAVIMPQKKWL
jgi:hypothetical protein